MKRVRNPILYLHGAVCSDEGLAHHLPAKHTLPTILGTAATEQIVLELL
jgi:hypothetical protein